MDVAQELIGKAQRREALFGIVGLAHARHVGRRLEPAGGERLPELGVRDVLHVRVAGV